MNAATALKLLEIENAPDLSISGSFKAKEIKQLSNATRTGTVGPTTVYYAGLTAPIISAGMSLMARNAFSQTTLSSYWVMLLTAMCAVVAGISWYLIFMRWSYRHQRGRSDEQQAETQVRLLNEGICVKRNHVTTHIMWSGVERVQSLSKGLIIHVHGASAIFVAKRWFDDKQISVESFEQRILDKISGAEKTTETGSHHGSQTASSQIA